MKIDTAAPEFTVDVDSDETNFSQSHRTRCMNVNCCSFKNTNQEKQKIEWYGTIQNVYGLRNNARHRQQRQGWWQGGRGE